MKFLLLFIFSLVGQAQNCKNLHEVRAIFLSKVNEQQLENMLTLCKQTNCKKTIPYYAAATMKKAEFVWSPISKFTNFNKGKKMLEQFILKNPYNIEARYIRWMTQKMAPSFLRYNKNITEDYLFILERISESTIEFTYQQTILSNIKKVNNE